VRLSGECGQVGGDVGWSGRRLVLSAAKPNTIATEITPTDVPAERVVRLVRWCCWASLRSAPTYTF